MGIIGKIVTSAYRYIRYGRQIGKTAVNGTKVYGRGKINRTAIDAEGRVTRTIRNTGSDKYTQRTQVTDHYANGTSRVANIRKSSDADGINKWYSADMSYIDRNGYPSHRLSLGKPKFINNSYNSQTKTFHTCIDSPKLGSDGLHTYNHRRVLDVKM